MCCAPQGARRAVQTDPVLLTSSPNNYRARIPLREADAYDTGAAGASTTLSTTNRIAVFICIATGVWITFLGGAVSS